MKAFQLTLCALVIAGYIIYKVAQYQPYEALPAGFATFVVIMLAGTFCDDD